jgi:putative redox protein
MNISVNWVDGMLMVGKSDSGHTITMDGPPEIGGENLSVRPMEMLLLGMAGCTMIDVVTTLKKMRENLVHCETQVSADPY